MRLGFAEDYSWFGANCATPSMHAIRIISNPSNVRPGTRARGSGLATLVRLRNPCADHVARVARLCRRIPWGFPRIPAIQRRHPGESRGPGFPGDTPELKPLDSGVRRNDGRSYRMRRTRLNLTTGPLWGPTAKPRAMHVDIYWDRRCSDLAVKNPR
jgi:hypothetical protein